jgi:isoleucyl-tRNA synthetase
MDTFPANFIAEGIDQTRGWLCILSVILKRSFDQSTFKNLIANRIDLANNGEKNVKKKGKLSRSNEYYRKVKMKIY